MRSHRTAFTLGAALVVSAIDLHAHSGEVDQQTSLWLVWNWNVPLLLVLAALTLFFGRGTRILWQRNGSGRGITRRQVWTFGLSILSLLIALVSPLDALSAELSSAHMVQHMILMNVAAPLLVMSSPLLAMSWAFTGERRTQLTSMSSRLQKWRPRWYRVLQPVFLWLVYGLTLWTWHLPALYQAALRDQGIHDLQHICFFAVSCVFWRVLLDPLKRLRFSRAWGIIYLFTTSLHATLLGVFMALSPRVWYPDYETTVPAWNLSALEDQQLAGLIMWMPACAVYALVAAVLFVTWVEERVKQGGIAN